MFFTLIFKTHIAMKRIALTVLIALTALSGFAQMMAQNESVKKKVVVVKKEAPKPQSAVVDFSGDMSQAHVVYGRIDENGDTLLMVMLPDLDIDLMQRYLQITETQKGKRLAKNVKKVYPYAKLAGKKMVEYDSLLAKTPTAAERRRLMKEAEDEILAQYTEDAKEMTFSQGAILIRLIDRETSHTSYQVVQEFRGKFRAFFYQGFARLWGYNLKTEYDPHNNPEDDDIETIMTLLERGVI
jgi:hypothetical protein